MVPKRLLILDDDPVVAATIGKIAEKTGFKAVFSTEIDGFADQYHSFDPTVIVLDLMMPDTDGVETLRYLAYQKCQAAVILVSGHHEKVLNTAHQLGLSHGLRMVEHLKKPFGAAELRRILQEAVVLLEENVSETDRAPNFFELSPESDELSATRRQITADDLSGAIDRGELVAAYQPLVDMKSEQVVGVEALARWHHPEWGVVMPDDFIPLAEQSSLIGQLTDVMLDMAIRQCSMWNADGRNLSVSINLSAKNLNLLGFPDQIATVQESHGLLPQHLVLEITERAAMTDSTQIMEVLSRLRIKNYDLAVDDFGTGFSSMVELRRMPFSKIKIDKSFVLECAKDEEALVFVRNMIELGHGLELSVTAEGVENKEIWDLLISLGCDVAQGYFISRPLGAEDMTAWMEQWSGIQYEGSPSENH